MKIVFASSNAGKINELQTPLQSLGLTIVTQSSLGVSSIEETGLTFVENALLKARHASQQTGLPAIADDSGLEVLALQGKPGIYSARYAGLNASSEDHIKKLLSELNEVPAQQRQANFYCVLVFLKHPEDPTPIICEGSWHGVIAHQPIGEQGFGYDPIFWIPSLDCSAAQLSAAQKNELSHRGQALRLLINTLPTKVSA